MAQFIANRFESFAEWISENLGNPWAFMIALFTVIIWAATGPLFQFSDTWQLVINTSTTIITFLMVFLLQNTGNRTIDEMHDRLKYLEKQNQELLEEMRKLAKP